MGCPVSKTSGDGGFAIYSLGNGLNGVSDNVAFMTKQLTDLDISTGGKYCTANFGPLGTLSRLKDLTSYGQAPIPDNVKVGDYYYVFTPQQAPCSANKEVQQLAAQQTNSLKTILQSLEAIK